MDAARNKHNPVGLFLITFIPADIIGKNLGDFGFLTDW